MAEDVHYINQPPSEDYHLDSGHESLVEGDNRALEEEEEDIGLVAWTGSSSSTEYGALEDETTSMSEGLEPSSPEEPWECDDETRDTLQVTKALGDLYHDRFKHLKQIFDIDMAIELYNQVISLLPEGTRRGLEPMIRLSKSYHLRYEHLGRLDDLQAAIDCHNRALPLVPEYNDLDKQKLLGNLGSLHRRRFEHLKNLEDLTESIRYLNDALNLAAEDPSNKPILLNSLGASYHSHFNVSGELESLTNAVAVQTQAVSLVSDDDPDKCVLLNDLGISHISLFKRLGMTHNLTEAISLQNKALALDSEERHADRPAWLNNLGNMYHSRFQRFGNMADLDLSIETFNQAVLLVQENHSDYPSLLSNLAGLYHTRFTCLGDPPDIDKAIYNHTQAALLTPAEHANKPGLLTNLGNLYHALFERSGMISDLDLAIEHHTNAISLAQNNRPSKIQWLGNLASAHRTRFERLGNRSDLDTAIECQERVVSLTPPDDPARPIRLNDLGNLMSLSFSTSGKLGDLDSAIMLGSEAAYLIPEDHPKKPAILNDLGGNYRSRFGYLNETADLDAAIECHENAVSLTPDGQITTPRRLHNLGNSYFIRFRHLGQLKDIDKAIMLQTKAVCQVSDGNRYKPNLLSNLGNSYCGRYMHSEEATDCENAIKYNSAAVSLCPSDHPDKPTWLSHLASCYFARFRRQNTSIDLDKATELSDLAVSLVPDGHPDKSIWLSNLADVYDARFRHSGIRSDIDKSITCFMEASKSAGTPSLRLEAARAWAALAALHQTPSSLEAYSLVMALLPQVVWLGSTIDRRYKDLRDLTGIVNEAAAIAIDAERYDLGLEWLEEGRSIVWKQILQFRSPLDDLAIVSPTLADDLRDVAHKLEIAGVRDLGDKDQLTTESFLEDAAQSHRRLAEKWDELLRKVRDLPGFGNFLRPRKLDELRRATGSGAVVIVNVFMSHCESLVLLPDQPEVVHIPLPELSHNIALEIQSQLKGSTRSDEGHIPIQRRPIFQDKAADDQFKRVLETLWLDVVKPVLKHIGYLEPLNDGQRPHVTWCTTGPLAQLPLHAAGLYDERKEMAFDYVISSYTPTITALLTPLPEPSSFQGILAVGQASTSGLAALPGTTEELARIKQLARGLKFTQVEGEKATADAVLSAMEDHSWVHLACHALQDANHPTSSALQLHESKINLITIARRSFKHATFAFLSACQTATGDEYLPEEAVHLSAGMLMAGYPTVIGTMWSIRDEDAPLVAREVYSRLLAGGMPNTVGVAQALHVAVEVLRAKVGEHEFARWVPFIHIGV